MEYDQTREMQNTSANDGESDCSVPVYKSPHLDTWTTSTFKSMKNQVVGLSAWALTYAITSYWLDWYSPHRRSCVIMGRPFASQSCHGKLDPGLDRMADVGVIPVVAK